MPIRGKIPAPTIKRLSLYLRELAGLHEAGEATISSQRLGKILGMTDAQVRKDLARFGSFGQSGVGYRIPELIEQIRRILSKDRTWPCALIGAGNIGRALVSYGRFSREGFDIVEVFDRSPEVIGTQVAGKTVRPIEQLADAIRQRGIRIGIIAVPGEAAQETAERLVAAGVAGILNFAPRRIRVDERVAVVSVDFSVALEQLAFQISLGTNTGRRTDLDESAG